MAEPDAEQIGAADLVVGLVPVTNEAPVMAGAIARIVESVPTSQAVLIYPPYSADGMAPPATNAHWRLVPDPRLAQDRAALAQSLGDSFRVIFDASLKAGARTCAVIASDLSTVTAEWVQLLLEPAAGQHFDLVAPCYAQHRFEALINRAIVYPLVRALYGKRIRNPLGPDFGISNTLLDRMVSGSRKRTHPLASLAAEAVTGKMRVCQSHLGPRLIPGADWANLSSILAQILGPLFLDMDRYASHWQRVRGSEPIVEFGQPIYAAGADSAVEVKRLIASFGLGTRNLMEVWGMILPPSTLVELQRLARHDSSAFRMPDETWARIVYDFALAHRLHTISRDQMLRALTPIYLGWVASYALELENASPEAVEQRLEQLCLAYENTKSYGCAMALAGSFQPVGRKGEIFMWDQVENTLRQSTVRVLSQFANWLPGVLALVVALLFACAIAWLLSAGLRRFLDGVHFDEQVKRWGFMGITEWSPHESATLLVTRVIAWAIVLFGFVLGLAAFDADLTSRLAFDLLAYVPNVIAAVVLVMVGTILARYLARSVLIEGVNMNFQYARLLSVGIKWMVMVLTAAMALDHLRIASGIVHLAFGILFGGIVFALALAVGLGAKEMVSRSLERESERAAAVNTEEPFRHF